MSPLPLAALLLLATPAPGPADPPGLVVEVSAGDLDRRDTPVVVEIPAGRTLPGGDSLVATDVANGSSVAAQALKTEPARVVWVVPELKAGTSRRYRIQTGGATSADPKATARSDGKYLTVRLNGREALVYHEATVESPPGIDPVYRKSGYVHPLKTPAGRELTGDFAADHAHQHGLFFAWVNTTYAGHKVDFWNQKEQTGRVRHVATLGTESGPVAAGFSVRLRHEDITRPGSAVPVLDEVWVVHAVEAGGVFVVDLESTQTLVGREPLQINKYHYGGFGLRGNTAWYDPKATGESQPDPARSGHSDFLTSEGLGRAKGNHSRPNWTALGGDLDGGAAGLAILDHPGNFRFPQPVRLHPNKPYFVYSPEVLGAFAIEPGKPYVSRYRLILRDGRPDRATFDRLWNDYASPPKVKVE